MVTLVALVVAVHALSAIYWSGCTFVASRKQAAEVKGLFASQMGAAVLACASGGLLIALLHRERRGETPVILMAGGVAAVAALMTQVAFKSRGVLSNRLSAFLLALAAISMVTWRHL